LARPHHSFAGGELAAPTGGWCRRAPSPARPRSRPTPGIGRRWAPKHSPTLGSRAFPSPELSSHRRPWRQGPNCNLNFRPEGLSAKFEGLFVNLSLLDLLNLAKFVENHSKIIKMQN
jgi:hypothetical protein